MSDEIITVRGQLAIDSIRASVRALIRPTALDYFKAAAEAKAGRRAKEAELYQHLLETRDKGRGAATRLSVLARDPNAAVVERYDEHIHKRRRGK